MNIDETIKVIGDSSNSFSTGDWTAIIVAIISAIVTMYVGFKTNSTTKKISDTNRISQENINAENNKFQADLNKNNEEFQAKISKKNEELQREITQKNIDANLIANARIEWIQNVRSITASLIGTCNTLLILSDKKAIEIEYHNSIEKCQLLSLYFGPENKNTNKTLKLDVLLDKESNEHKNDWIVYLIELIHQRLSNYHFDVRNDRFEKLDELLSIAKENVFKSSTLRVVDSFYDDEGEEHSISQQSSFEGDIKYLNDVKFEKDKAVEEISAIHRDLVLLGNVIRIYLKIEWNQAKTGQ